MADKKISQLTNSGTLTGTELVPIVQSGATVKTTVALIAASETYPAAYTYLSTFGTVGIAAQGGFANANPNAGAETNYAGTVYTWVVRNPAATTTVWSAQLVQPSGAYVDSGDLVFKYQTTERFRLTSDGNFVPKTAAKGINFTANTPAAGMTSQLLNWYEEGTWTPVIAGQTSAGTGTYTSQVGRYTRIGRAVHFTAYVVWTAHTGTGTMVLNGLPFASNSTSGVFYSFTPFNSNLTYTTNYQLALVLFNNSTTLTFYEMNNGVAANQINVDTAADIIVSGTYFV